VAAFRLMRRFPSLSLASLSRVLLPISLAALAACATTANAPPGAAAGSPDGGTPNTLTSPDATTGTSAPDGAAHPSGGDSGSTAVSGADSSGASGEGSGSTGASGADGAAEAASGPASYALGPPNQCDNQFSVSGCTAGDTSTACGGTCSAQSACEGTKPNNPQIGFLCPRFILFGDEMTQAAKDDFGPTPPFNYAIVGHDPDQALDQNGTSGTRSCCQCYQLVFDVPNEAEAQVAGQSSGASAVPVPPPLVVQAFNTSAGGGQNFDVYMGAGGFGANNACDPNFSQKSASGKYLYTSFPEVGEGGNGGEKAAIVPACDTNENLITTDTLSSTACQSQIASDCGEIAAASSSVAEETIQSCIQSNAPNTFYHLNWKVYAKKVQCPAHLTQVTGCELAPQNLPDPDPNVTTAAQAAADSSFASGYTTTTMQDCCKPTCAWQDNVSSAGTAVGEYNSFYTCDSNGNVVTQ
jgi:hypothetical protein